VTIASILCGFVCGLCYAFGWFVIGSILLFISHILDCTDGNLARARETFNPFGKWLDMIGDRISEIFIFMGVCIYYLKTGSQIVWIILPVVDALILAVYYYIVDISLALGISSQKQNLTSISFKGVSVKWGIMEPVIYGFIILAPLGFLKVQISLILALTLCGISYHIINKQKTIHSM
jgi:phosphatidylglycerophosphate synthase